MRSLNHIPKSLVRNTVILFPTNEVFSASLASFGIPLRLSSSSDTEQIAPFVIDESQDKLMNNYKIMMNSLHPGIPNKRKYISDFITILSRFMDVEDKIFNPMVGFYHKTEIHKEEDIKEGDLVLMDGSHLEGYNVGCEVFKILDIRTGLWGRMFGRYKIDCVFPTPKDKRQAKAPEMVGTTVTYEGKQVGNIRIYRLRKYNPLEKSQATPQRYHAGHRITQSYLADSKT